MVVNQLLGPIASALVAGVLAFVGTVFTGKIVVPVFVYERERAGREKWEAESMRLNALISEKFAPALEQSAATNARSAEALASATLALHDEAQRRRP